MKYDYNPELECFVREDGLGKKIWINSSEAQRIVTMYNLGNSIGEIRNKIHFQYARRVTESTIKNFILNIQNGNIVLSDDYPAPKKVVYELTLEERISNLEKRMDEFESMNDKSFADKVKSWIS